MRTIHPMLETVAAHLLSFQECEAVLGDIAEAEENSYQASLELLGLIVRRQLELWKAWRPWLTGFGIAFPGSLLLMGLSLSVSYLCRDLVNGMGQETPSALAFFCRNVLLLIGWSWCGGFVLVRLSRRTLWASILLSCLPCLFCLLRYREQALPSICLLLFFIPRVWGAGSALRRQSLKRSTGISIAVAVTLLTIAPWIYRGGSIADVILLWPALYLAISIIRFDRRQTAASSLLEEITTGE